MKEAIKKETHNAYHERINKVLNYIHNHLGEKLDLQSLASHGNYSAYHFHRIMRAHLGESLGAYVIRLRLETSAHLLRMTEIPVYEISEKFSYENPPAFNKAFKKRFGVSPLEYREDKSMQLRIHQSQINPRLMENLNTKPKIRELRPRTVIYAQSVGPYSESAGASWEKLMAFAKAKKLFGFRMEFIGISFDDPDITEPEKLRYHACLTVSRQVIPEGEIGVKEIAGGKYAVFTHSGPYEKLSDSYRYIYGYWIPENDIKLRDVPVYEKYLNTPARVKPEKLRTEIHLPIE